MILRGTALVPGTCGELVQGTLSGTNFLVTCPVNWFSRVTVTTGADRSVPSTPSTRDGSPLDTIRPDAPVMNEDASPGAGRIVFPAERIKTAQAVRKTLDREGYPNLGAVIDVASSLPIGKGMGSSTADLSAACYAVATALNRRLTPEAVAEIALSIEPSDGTFSTGIILIDHVDGRLFERIGEPFPLGLLVLDFGGAVDTLEFHRRSDLAELNAANEPVIRQALQLVRDGFQRQDPGKLGEGATMSALANQRILPKSHLEAIIDHVLVRGAYGVNVAHSGTVVGILLPPGREADEQLIRGLRTRFSEIRDHYSLRLTGGGPRYPGKIRTGGKVCVGQAPARRERCIGGSQVWH
ncbi:MAG: GHMP kinase [Thermacetogeniaceae bacterium]